MTGPGCYTVLRNSNDEQPISDYGDNYNEDYGYSQYYYPSYWTLSPRWGRYYAVPWWWDYDYYQDTRPIYYEDDGSTRSSGGEKATPATRYQEPYTTGTPGVSRGGTYGTGTSSSSSSSPSTATKQKSSSNETETNTSTPNVQTKTKEQKQESSGSKSTRQGRKK